jgi:hypothetical protein
MTNWIFLIFAFSYIIHQIYGYTSERFIHPYPFSIPMGLFSKGSIRIQLKKYSFNPGENIEGTLQVSLKKPTKGKALRVGLYGKRIDRYVTTDGIIGSGSKQSAGSSTESEIFYKFEQPVAGSQEYHNNDFDFTLQIPPNVLEQAQQIENKMVEDMEKATSAIKVITGGTTKTQTQVKWVVKAILDLPGFDVSKGQDITLIKPTQ